MFDFLDSEQEKVGGESHGPILPFYWGIWVAPDTLINKFASWNDFEFSRSLGLICQYYNYNVYNDNESFPSKGIYGSNAINLVPNYDFSSGLGLTYLLQEYMPYASFIIDYNSLNFKINSLLGISPVFCFGTDTHYINNQNGVPQLEVFMPSFGLGIISRLSISYYFSSNFFIKLNLESIYVLSYGYDFNNQNSSNIESTSQESLQFNAGINIGVVF